MTQYRYEAHVVPGMVWDDVKIGGQYLGGEVVDGISGMDNDLVLIVAYPNAIVDVAYGTGPASTFRRDYG